MKYFSDNLKFLRSENKISQEQLASALGLNRGNIASYEKGTAEPKMDNLVKIVNYFNIEFRDLVETDLANRRAVQEELAKIGENLTDISAAGISPEDIAQELHTNSRKLEAFAEQCGNMQKILDGFRQYHQFQMGRNEEVSQEVKKMSQDYEKLLDLMEELLLTNRELIGSIKESPR